MQSLGSRDGFDASAYTQLTIDTADLGLNRIGGDDESFSHLGVRLPSDQQTQHSLFLQTQGRNRSPLRFGVLRVKGRTQLPPRFLRRFFFLASPQPEQSRLKGEGPLGEEQFTQFPSLN